MTGYSVALWLLSNVAGEIEWPINAEQRYLPFDTTP